MANTKYILDKIKIEGAVQDVFARSQAEDVTVTYKGAESTLAAAIVDIVSGLSSLPTTEEVSAAISAAVNELIDGAPDTYDTLKEIADYIESHKDVTDALNAAIGNKVDKIEGKGLSTEDFTTALKDKLESMTTVTAAADGLMSKDDKKRLDALRGVRYGTETPADLQNGELFVRVVSQ